MKVWAALFLLILILHGVWLRLDGMPPVWDMAHHQILGWEYLRAWQEGRFLSDFHRLTDYYPPLYYLQLGLLLRFFGDGYLVPLLANLTGIFLFSFCTWRLASRVADPHVARLGGILVLLLPMVAWTSRTTLLELPLAGWVTAGGLLVWKSAFFRKRSWTLLFGAVAAAGLLTKWTFVLFLAPPVLYALVQSPERRRSLIHLLDAVLLAVPPVFWWYLPNLQSLVERFQLTAAAAVLEGDPPVWSLLGFLYYPRSLFSYYFYLPLFLALLGGLERAWKRRRGVRSPALGFLAAWLLGSLLLLTLLEAKDPRYVLPLVSPAAIFLVLWVRGRRRLSVVLLAVAFLQFLAVSFHPSPVRVAIFDIPDDKDYRTLRQEWVLFQSHYFDVAGAPRRQDWRYDDILKALPEDAKVGFAPETPHFQLVTLQLRTVRSGRRVEVVRVGERPESLDWLERLDFVVGKTGFQGISYLTGWNEDVYIRLEESEWPLAAEWELPDRSLARIWRNPTRSPSLSPLETPKRP